MESNESKRVKRINTIEKKNEELKLKKEEVNDMKLEVINKEFKNNLAEYMDKRLMEFAQRLQYTEENANGLSTIEINSIMRAKNNFGTKITYTVEELAVLFEYYIEYMRIINDKIKYPPSKKNFCAFAGISSVTYDNYKTSDDSQRREIMMMIDDFITDTQLTSAQMREISEITTMFRTKAEHGMYEAQAPVVIQHETTKSTTEILNDIKKMKELKTLKTIELEENNYKVEE